MDLHRAGVHQPRRHRPAPGPRHRPVPPAGQGSRAAPIRLHDVRHSAATHFLAAGVEMKVVSEILGHATTAITADLYTSVIDDLK